MKPHYRYSYLRKEPVPVPFPSEFHMRRLVVKLKRIFW